MGFLKFLFGEQSFAAAIDARAAATLNSASRAARVILERRAALDRAGLYRRPLIVVAGENHAVPSHQVHHMLLLDRLRRSEETVLGYEQPHNLLEQVFHDHALEKEPKVLAALKEQDKRGALSLKTAQGFFVYRFADVSLASFSRFLLRRDIPVRFTDAADQNHALGRQDPSTADSLRDCFGDAAKASTESRRMRMRNHHMAKLAVAFARENQARIIIQQCGNAHVAGWIRGHFGLQHSLFVQCRGLPVIATFLLDREFTADSLPCHDRGTAKDLTFLSGVPEARAIYDQSDRPVLLQPAELQNQAAEANYVNSLLEHVGLGSEILPPRDLKAMRAAYKAEMRDLYSQRV